MKNVLVLLLILNANLAFAGTKHLQCALSTTLNNSAAPASLDIQANLANNAATIVNGVQVTKAVNPAIAAQLGMSMIVLWNGQQVSISSDFSKAFIKDIASYSCNPLN